MELPACVREPSLIGPVYPSCLQTFVSVFLERNTKLHSHRLLEIARSLDEGAALLEVDSRDAGMWFCRLAFDDGRIILAIPFLKEGTRTFKCLPEMRVSTNTVFDAEGTILARLTSALKSLPPD